MNKTDNAANVGKHKFELAGLGMAPFRFIGASENAITYPDGTTKAVGSCDYCGKFKSAVDGINRIAGRFHLGDYAIALHVHYPPKGSHQYEQNQNQLRRQPSQEPALS